MAEREDSLGSGREEKKAEENLKDKPPLSPNLVKRRLTHSLNQQDLQTQMI